MSQRAVLMVLFCSAGLLSISGCATQATFVAQSLPQQLEAPYRQNAQTVDLSRIASAAASKDRIHHGDVLEVSISAGLGPNETTRFRTRVADDGTAILPELGNLQLVGLELQDAEAQIAMECINQKLYRAPNVTVTMASPKVNRVTVVGAVKEPGQYDLRTGNSDLLAAIVSAGGLADDAGTNVEIRHPGFRQTQRMDSVASARRTASGHRLVSGGEDVAADPVSVTSPGSSVRINLVSATHEGSTGYPIQDGTVVMVERRDPEPIHVIGLVRSPGRYDMPVGKDLRLLDAIALAGGVSNPVADKIFVIRRMEGQAQPALVAASITRAKESGAENLRLAPGDVISVEHTPATTFVSALQTIGIGLSGRVF